MLQNHSSEETPAALVGAVETGPLEQSGISAAELEELASRANAGKLRSKRQSKSMVRTSMAVLFSLAVGMIAWVFIMLNLLRNGAITPAGTLPLSLIEIVLMPFLPFAVVLLQIKRMRTYRSNAQELDALNKLLEIDDVRVVGPLIDLAALPNTLQKPEFWAALERFLPRMTEQEILQLGAERHATLAFWIQSWDIALNRKIFAQAGGAFLPKLISVITQIGQSAFTLKTPAVPTPVGILPTLKKWSEGKGSGQDAAVREAALLCRQAIEKQAELDRTGAQLLRASEATPIAREQLLHPVQGTQETDPQELLRPGASKE